MDISLDNNIQFFNFTLLNLLIKIFQRNPAINIEGLFLDILSPSFSNLTGFFFIFQNLYKVTGIKNIRETQDLYRHGRSCLLDLLALIIKHGPDPATNWTCQD